MGVFNCSLSARECYQGPSEQVMRPRRRLKRSPARMAPKAIARALGEVSDAAGGRFSPVPKGCGPFCLPRRSGPRLRRPCYDLRTAPSGRQNGSQRGSHNLFRGSLGKEERQVACKQDTRGPKRHRARARSCKISVSQPRNGRSALARDAFAAASAWRSHCPPRGQRTYGPPLPPYTGRSRHRPHRG